MSSGLKITFWVQPGAKKNEVVGEIEGAIKVKIAAPPVEGKANKELIAFIAKILSLKKSAITIESGESSRRKIVAIEGMSAEEARKILLGKN
jgi:hypothetical protein